MTWQPFTEPARRSIVRAQEVAQTFGSSTIGTEHMAFALAESADETGSALAGAVDREAIQGMLERVSAGPTDGMVFSQGAKQSIELAFAAAHRLQQHFIGTAHLALGIVASSDPPPLNEPANPTALRAALELAATHEQQRIGESAVRRPAASRWERVSGDDSCSNPAALLGGQPGFAQVEVPGTRVSLTIAAPGAEERTWTWVLEEPPAS